MFEFASFQVEYEMFVDKSSASEIGTSHASINRTGKTNAAKGVQSHYNEYKDFHKCEVEGHILAAFMEFSGMSNIEGKFNHHIKTSYVS